MGESLPARERALMDLQKLAHGLVEEVVRSRHSLELALEHIMPRLVAATGALGMFVHTIDDESRRRTIRWPADLVVPDLDGVLVECGSQSRGKSTRHEGGRTLVAQALDVAGEWLGAAGLVARVSHEDAPHLALSLDLLCEEIDGFLDMARAAGAKHRLALALGRALRAPILPEGLAAAVAILAENVSVAKLLIAFTPDEAGPGTAPVHVQFYDREKLVFDSHRDANDREAITEEASRWLVRGDRALRQRFGAGAGVENVLVRGHARDAVLGKIFASSPESSFNAHERDLLETFADLVLQRVIDFNKEWRALSRSFRPECVARLLHTPNYMSILAPREETVAILFADISGFTRISEQVLVDPAKIGALIDTWGHEVVQLTWEHGGVFDKMVGDCLVALFGPPFYETSPAERLEAAIRTACAIRDCTRRLHRKPGLSVLEGSGIGVATGINLAPLFVGRFGPNDNFTGFSSGMNNTARLQHVASKDEILVMHEATEALPKDAFRFSESRQAQVKNVAHPLRFKALLE